MVEARKAEEKAKAAALDFEQVSEVEPVTAKPKESKESKEKLSQSVLGLIEDILHGNAVDEAKHDITDLKEKVIEHTEDLMEVGSVSKDFEESKVAKRIRSRVNTMISGMDTLVAKLESERRNIKEDITSKTHADTMLEVASDKSKSERLVKIKDLLDSLTKLKKMTDEASSKHIEEVLKALDVDTDGIVDANLVLEVLEILGNHKDVEISAGEMKKMVEMLRKEDAIEAIEADPRNNHGEIPGSPEQKLIPNIPADDEFPIRSKSPLPPIPPPSQKSSNRQEVKGPPPATGQ